MVMFVEVTRPSNTVVQRVRDFSIFVSKQVISLTYT